MNISHISLAPLFAQPLNLRRELAPRPDITRPFQAAWRRPAQHDMLLLTARPDLLPAPEPTQEETPFFDFDRP